MNNNILLFSASFALLFPLIAGILRFKRQLPLWRTVSIYVFVAAAMEILCTLFWLYKQNNLFLLHMYTAFEFGIISVFYSILFKKRLKAWLIPLLVTGFMLLSLADAFFIHDLEHFNLYARATECIIIICYALFYFYGHLQQTPNASFGKDPVFLVNAAFLFYFSFSFFLFLFSNYIIKVVFTQHLLWDMHALAQWVYYTTIGIALWKVSAK